MWLTGPGTTMLSCGLCCLKIHHGEVEKSTISHTKKWVNEHRLYITWRCGVIWTMGTFGCASKAISGSPQLYIPSCAVQSWTTGKQQILWPLHLPRGEVGWGFPFFGKSCVAGLPRQLECGDLLVLGYRLWYYPAALHCGLLINHHGDYPATINRRRGIFWDLPPDSVGIRDDCNRCHLWLKETKRKKEKQKKKKKLTCFWCSCGVASLSPCTINPVCRPSSVSPTVVITGFSWLVLLPLIISTGKSTG